MTKTSRQIGTLFGFPISIDFTFLILCALFVFPNFGNTIGQHLAAILTVPVLLVSIILHELGHAWAIRRFGYGRSRILLWGMGGLCIGRSARTPGKGMLISLAGPAAGLLLGIPALALYQANLLYWQVELGEALTLTLYFVAFVNVGWSVLNLLPVFPLDGGRALMYGLRFFLKQSRNRSARIAGLVGLILILPLGILCIVGKEWWMIFVLFFIGRSTWQAWKKGVSAVGEV